MTSPRFLGAQQTPWCPTVTMTVRAVIGAYLRHCEANEVHGPDAKRERLRTLREFDAIFGDVHVIECKAYLLSDWVEAHATWRSVSTRRGKANTIRAAFNWAVETDRIEKNPFTRVRYAEAERRPEFPDDLLEVVCRVASKPFEAALRWLRYTGCRSSEMCAAKWADVDVANGVWTIHRHKSRRYTQRPKIVAIVPLLIDLLKRMRAEPATLFPVGDDDFIFLNTAGRPWTRQTLTQTLARIKKRHGIKTPACIHSIRHRAATAMIAGGAPIKLVAEQLGHASVVTTERYYHRPSIGHIEEMRAAAQLGLKK